MAALLVLSSLVLQHLGKLHPIEQTLVLALAFGPVALLAVTVWIARRRDAEDEDGR